MLVAELTFDLMKIHVKNLVALRRFEHTRELVAHARNFQRSADSCTCREFRRRRGGRPRCAASQARLERFPRSQYRSPAPEKLSTDKPANKKKGALEKGVKGG